MLLDDRNALSKVSQTSQAARNLSFNKFRITRACLSLVLVWRSFIKLKATSAIIFFFHTVVRKIGSYRSSTYNGIDSCVCSKYVYRAQVRIQSYSFAAFLKRPATLCVWLIFHEKSIFKNTDVTYVIFTYVNRWFFKSYGAVTIHMKRHFGS